MSTIPRHLRAWDYSAELRREQNVDAAGWEPDDPERDPDVYSAPLCPCGSGLEVEADGGCICCWFARTGAAA